MDNKITEAKKPLVNFDVIAQRQEEEEKTGDNLNRLQELEDLLTVVAWIWSMDRDGNYSIEDYLAKTIARGGDWLKLDMIGAKFVLNFCDRWGAAVRIFLRNQGAYSEDA